MANVVAAVVAAGSAAYGMWSGERGRGNASKARRRQRALTGRAYQTNMGTWRRNKALSEKWSKHWQNVAENPGKENPYFSTFKSDVGEAAEASRGKMYDALRKSGRTGSGKLVEFEKDLQSASERSLSKTLASIQQDATAKQQQAEGSLGPRPFLGMAGSVPSLGDENFTAQHFTPQMPDFSGLGGALAYMGNKKKPPGGEGYGNWRDLWNTLDYPNDDFEILT